MTSGSHPTRSPRELLRQAARVAADAPLFLAAPLMRRRHLWWGATRDEVVTAMPGDDLLPHAQYRCTRAVTVDAPPARVWPWLVQVGFGRAGFYSDDLLDNLGRPSARTIEPAWQHLEVGVPVPMSRGTAEPTTFRVRAWEEPQWLLWDKPDSTWSWRLTELPDGRTRLVTRVHAVYDWSNPLVATVAVALMELGDFAMMRRMLLGIKERAEAPEGVS